jgi:hypothetical protein
MLVLPDGSRIELCLNWLELFLEEQERMAR